MKALSISAEPEPHAQRLSENRRRTIALVHAFAPHDGGELGCVLYERLELGFLERERCITTDGVGWHLTDRGRTFLTRFFADGTPRHRIA